VDRDVEDRNMGKLDEERVLGQRSSLRGQIQKLKPSCSVKGSEC
jgi:hypothetical protein